MRLLATGGQAGDGPQILPLLAGLTPGKVLADTASDSDSNPCAYCAQHHIEAVIPNRPNRLEPVELDEETYRDRNKFERFFGQTEAVSTPGHALRKKRRFFPGSLAHCCGSRLAALIVLTP